MEVDRSGLSPLFAPKGDVEAEQFECPAAKRVRLDSPPPQPPPPPAPTAPALAPAPAGAAAAHGSGAGGRLVADKYLVLEAVEGSSLYRCVNVHTQEELVCKVARGREAGALVRAHGRLADAPSLVSALREALPCAAGACLVLGRARGVDLHSHVRSRRRLREAEARPLWAQAAAAVAACHARGVVLRDLKLRKFVFADQQRTQLRLESLEDAVVLSSPHDDLLRDKRGCPAYVSPEILRPPPRGYSGRAADMWSLGVILYTMLVGRYPFNETQHQALFAKISRGAFALPEHLSPAAKCLIRSLLRRDPAHRLTAADVLLHPWLKAPSPTPAVTSSVAPGEREAPRSTPSPRAPTATPVAAAAATATEGDQVVPDVWCP